jgi:VanZ family protein
MIAGLLWFAVIFLLLTIPENDFPKISWIDAIHGDKLVHIGLFFILCYFFSLFVIDRKNALTLIFIISVLALLYGIAMEFVQKYFTKSRSFEIGDMVADGIGAFLSYFWWRYKIKSLDRNRGRNQN